MSLKCGRRAGGRVVLGSLICAAIVMCATSARAEPPTVTRTVTDEQNAPFSDMDPCIGNAIVAGTGHQHTVFIDRSTATKVDTTFRISQDGEGLNTTNTSDTREYRFASFGDTDLKSSSKNFSFTMITREHIIQEGHDGPGADKDDYFASTSIKMTSGLSKPTFTRQKAESKCK
jgi:hypothetical protein